MVKFVLNELKNHPNPVIQTNHTFPNLGFRIMKIEQFQHFLATVSTMNYYYSSPLSFLLKYLRKIRRWHILSFFFYFKAALEVNEKLRPSCNSFPN